MLPEEKQIVVAIIVLILIMLTIVVIQPLFEARTFNKFSNTKATYWDALVSELRVLPQ